MRRMLENTGEQRLPGALKVAAIAGPTQRDAADLNNDGAVDALDAMIVGANWNHLAYPPYYRG